MPNQPRNNRNRSYRYCELCGFAPSIPFFRKVWRTWLFEIVVVGGCWCLRFPLYGLLLGPFDVLSSKNARFEAVCAAKFVRARSGLHCASLRRPQNGPPKTAPFSLFWPQTLPSASQCGSLFAADSWSLKNSRFFVFPLVNTIR